MIICCISTPRPPTDPCSHWLDFGNSLFLLLFRSVRRFATDVGDIHTRGSVNRTTLKAVARMPSLRAHHANLTFGRSVPINALGSGNPCTLGIAGLCRSTYTRVVRLAFWSTHAISVDGSIRSRFQTTSGDCDSCRSGTWEPGPNGPVNWRERRIRRRRGPWGNLYGSPMPRTSL